MPPQLLSLTDGPDILLDKPILLVGRHQECDIQIPSRKISRRHCCIAQVDDHLVVRDLGSTNGIRINGSRVNEGQLKSGDELVIGNYKYEVRLGSGQNGVAERAAAAPAAAANHAPLAPAPNDSWEEPVALSEPAIDIPLAVPVGAAPILPTNKSNPPPRDNNLPNVEEPPMAILPEESMSIEPLSDKYAPPPKE